MKDKVNPLVALKEVIYQMKLLFFFKSHAVVTSTVEYYKVMQVSNVRH